MNKRKTSAKKNSRYTADFRKSINKSQKTSWLSKLFSKKSNPDQSPKLDKLVKPRQKPKPKIQRKTQQSNQPKKSKPVLISILLNLSKFLLIMISLPLQLVLWPFKSSLQKLFKVVAVRENLILASFLAVFMLISFRFAQLQIVSADSRFALGNKVNLNNSSFIIPARRGEIYISDFSQNKDNIPVTASQIQFDIFFDGRNLQSLVAKGLDLEKTSLELASRVNLPLNEVRQNLTQEVAKDKPSASVILARNISQEQKQSVEFLRRSDLNKRYNFQHWIGTLEKQTRSYPENKLLAATIGYTPDGLQPTSEIEDRFQSCMDMVRNNRARNTDTGQYIVGSYGLEQKYCSDLGGLNGKQFISASEDSASTQVINGADLHLTIDINIQREAERLLENAVIANTNENGAPKNGSIIVAEVKTGKLLAMASYPYFDPNEFEKYWLENPKAFRNANTSIDYDIGSIMKPLTVAAALNTYQTGVTVDGQLKGVPADFTFTDYGEKGKAYQEINGRTLYVQNADGADYSALGRIGLKAIVRDSINTGIADIVDETGAEQLRQYYKERFKFGEKTLVNLPGDEHGNVTNFDNDIGCPFCWANFGYGQGFTISPLQVIRAYTAIANKGRLVEPYLVEKIEYSDGSVDYHDQPGSSISQPISEQVISESTANLVTGYMQAVIEEGFAGTGRSNPAKVDGYYLAGKTGTAEVNRPYQVLDQYGNPLLDEDDNPILRPCNYECNRKRGIYDHSFVGFGPVRDPEYLIIVKLSEPRPGVNENFSSQTVAPVFSDMMRYTLSYMNVERDY
jgi:cell division protein FtsI/penicillin-binding protein 2